MDFALVSRGMFGFLQFEVFLNKKLIEIRYGEFIADLDFIMKSVFCTGKSKQTGIRDELSGWNQLLFLRVSSLSSFCAWFPEIGTDCKVLDTKFQSTSTQ